MHANAERSLPRPALTGGRSWRRQAAALTGFLAVSWVVSLLGSLPIRMNAGWYALADKAPWTPPGWIFGSVWLVLYAAMAVAAWLVWRQRHLPAGLRFKVYGVLLLLNLAWPLTFFGLYPMMGAAALWLALLLIGAHAVVATLTVLVVRAHQQDCRIADAALRFVARVLGKPEPVRRREQLTGASAAAGEWGNFSRGGILRAS